MSGWDDDEDDDTGWGEEACNYDGEDWESHQHCMNCGECECPGYCDDTATYNLRPPVETGGPAES